jgi:hypothetical protein
MEVPKLAVNSPHYHPPSDKSMQNAIAINRELRRRNLSSERIEKFMEQLRVINTDVDEGKGFDRLIKLI